MGFFLYLLLAGITYVVLQFTHFGHIEYTDNARVCQYIAPQNTRVQGFIKQIRFEAYQHVCEGDTLVIIEDSEFRLRLAQAKSDLARAQQQSKQAGSSVRTASSNISATEASKAEAKANLDNLAREDQRCEQLLRTGSVSQQIADQTHSAYLAAQARYEQICHTIDMQRSMADETSYNRSAVEAAVKLAEVAVELAELNLSYCYIIASHSGFVGSRDINIGELVNPGQTLVSIVDENQKWVEANYRETQLPQYTKVRRYLFMWMLCQISNIKAASSASPLPLAPRTRSSPSTTRLATLSRSTNASPSASPWMRIE